METRLNGSTNETHGFVITWAIESRSLGFELSDDVENLEIVADITSAQWDFEVVP